MLLGLIYAAIGALAGALLDKLAATYLMLFLVMTDLGVVQTPMFGHGHARRGGPAPGLRAPRGVMLDGAYFLQVPRSNGELAMIAGLDGRARPSSSICSCAGLWEQAG